MKPSILVAHGTPRFLYMAVANLAIVVSDETFHPEKHAGY